MSRVRNFSPGPATLPDEVLRQAAAEMLDWQGVGVGVMEMSHRSKEYMGIYEQAESDLRELMAIPTGYRVIFMQGGAIGQNAIVPLNLMGTTGSADYVVTGSWSTKSRNEAMRYGDVHLAASSEADGFRSIPAMRTWRLSAHPAYLFLCSNETISGVEFRDDPDLSAIGREEVPVVADMSSNILSRPMDVSKYGLIFAGAQKNIGPAGVTVVIVRDDLLGHASPYCPSVFDYKIQADNTSMFNTPPSYGIYIAGLVFQWLKRQGGLQAMEQRNARKAAMLYDFLDSTDFYRNTVEPASRSRMNVTFFLRDESLNEAFLDEAKAAGLVALKGHKSAGGMRASIYNAMPVEGVRELVDFMRDFARRRG